METICMKYQILFSEKNKKNYHQVIICWISPGTGKGQVCQLKILSLDSDTCANSVDPDETAHNKFAIMFLILDWNPYLHQWTCPNSSMEKSTSGNQGWKG